MDRGALLSPCREYRYTLWRRWDETPMAMFVGLNPSTADETLDDPTIRRCVGFARSWGYGGLLMCNLFGLRATDPAAMKAAIDPVGSLADQTLLAEAQRAAVVVAAWGTHGAHLGRGAAVRRLLTPYRLHYLRLTKDGHPSHPLYLPASLTPTLWQ